MSARYRGRPLNEINRADFEQLEERVEARELARHLAEEYDSEDEQ